MVNLEQWLPDVQELPAIPAAVTRLLVALDAPGTSASEIARIVESDPALASKVLRLANSAAYGLPEKVANVHRATVCLGFSTLKGLALSHGLYLALQGQNRDLLDNHFWAHCVAAGIASLELARKSQEGLLDDAFIIGLLHDVGQILLAYWFRDDYTALIREHREGSVPLAVLESQRLGVSHAVVGGAFLRHWGMPATLVHAVEFHHELYRVPSTTKRYPALAELADTCAQRAGYYGLSGSNPNRAYSAGALRMLRTTPEAMEKIEELLQREVPRQAGLLKIEAPPIHSVRLIPGKAA